LGGKRCNEKRTLKMADKNLILTKDSLKSPAVILFGATYVFAFILTLLSNPTQALIYLGMSLGILLLIWLILDITKKYPVTDFQVKRPWLELGFGCVSLILFQITPYLYLGDNWALGEIIKKEILYFALPLVFLRLCGNPFSSLGFSLSGWKQNLKVTGIILACMIIPCIFMISDTGRLILGGRVSPLQALPAFILYFLHNVARSGLPEEFIFRVLIQTRLSHIIKSRLGGILLTSLLFGLVHISSYPEMRLSEAFCTAFFLQSFMGLVFGVIWDRTRNLIPGVLVHSGVNALNNVGEAISMIFQ
jgi:membrane protease YdiL (CAAX protease family)